MLPNRFRSFAVAAGFAALTVPSLATLAPDNGVNLGTGDDSAFVFALGGSFNFYGNAVSTIYMTTNGYLSTNNAPGDYFLNFPIATDPIIGTFLDDLDSRGTGYYNDAGSTANYDQF